MRISRSIQLIPEFGHVHKFWRCHNKEYLLKSPLDKDLYLQQTKYALAHKSIDSNVKLHSFCIMDNHTHMNLSYERSSEYLSDFMRIAHSRFGFAYNKSHKRSGKVANERPKTPLIENHEHNLQVHFYIEANPLRAKMMTLDQLKKYPYCSYGFYAFGIKSTWTELLTIPDWYLKLGNTPIERQTKYRRLFKEYVTSETGIINPKKYFEHYIGGQVWCLKMYESAKKNSEGKKENLANTT